MRTLLLLCTLFISTYSLAQTKYSIEDPVVKCYTDSKMQEIYESNPEYEQELEQSFKESDYGRNHSSERSSAVITIPVHVILLHSPGQAEGTGTNFSMAHVMSQIDVLNQDFGRYNADAGNTPPEFPASDSGIQFCLASVDPNGLPTDGITRYGTTQNMDSNESAIKNATGWDRNSYLNIWSAPGIGALGWAYLPTTGSLPPANLDGTVIRAAAFGGPGFATQGNYNLGRTATHEVGHYLGLRHIWRNSGCGTDDGIADTPLQDDENFGCPSHPQNTCGSNDMFMNYMDYVNDNCMNAFSTGQGTYMNSILTSSRASLLGSAATNCVVIQPLSIFVTSMGNPLCWNSNDGFIIAEANGGVGPYTYSINGAPFTTNNIFTDLPENAYEVAVQDASGSFASVNVNIIAPQELFLTLVSETDNLCASDAAGTIEVSAAGGTSSSGNYGYAVAGGPTQSSPIFTDLTSGSYTIVVFDDNMCMQSVPATIESPDPILAELDSSTDVQCNGDGDGSIVVDASGGTGTLMYTLDAGTPQANNTFNNLDGGTYDIAVTDENDCEETLEVTIAEPDVLEATTSESTSVSCAGSTDGMITVSASGGTGDYMYSIDDVNYVTDNEFGDLGAGNYMFYIMDENGCETTVSYELSEPTALIMTVDNVTDVECFGEMTGAIMVSAAGGTGNYTYTLDGISNSDGIFMNLTSGDFMISVTDDNDCENMISATIEQSSSLSVDTQSTTDINCFGEANGSITVNGAGGEGNLTYSINNGPFQSSPTFENLTAGDYEILVKDGNDCLSQTMASLSEPDIISIDLTNNTPVSCFGGSDGSVDIAVSGGVAPYSISGTNGSEIGQNLPAGQYMIAVLDANNCEMQASYTIDEPTDINITVGAITPYNCDMNQLGSTTATAEGGTGALTYSLDGRTNTTGVFDDLIAGNYTMIVEDENGCTNSESIDIPQEGGIEATLQGSQNISCNGESDGSISISAEGGAGNYTYTLNGESNEDGMFSGLPAGEYQVNISDNANCEVNTTVLLTEPEVLNLVVDDFAHGDGFGFVTVAATGGTAPFQYSIDNGTTYQDSPTFENLAADNYTVMVQDANGCTTEVSVFISSDQDLSLELLDLTIYPNPTLDQTIASFTLTEAMGMSVVVFNLSGQMVKEIPAANYQAGDHQIRIDLSNLPPALYMIKMFSQDASVYRKLIKQ